MKKLTGNVLLFKSASTVVFLLFCCLSSFAQVTFVIDDLPKGTSPSDSIFICGTFNNWSTDPKLMLHKRLDGRYAITLPVSGPFEYKFHRGDWSRVETSSRNQYMANRKYQQSDGKLVHVFIANWQDLGGAKPFEVVSFYFFAMAILALTAVYFLLQIRNPKRNRTRAVVSFLALLSGVLLGRVVIEVVSLPWQFQLGLLGDIAVVLAGPFWLQILLTHNSKAILRWVHLVPSAFLLIMFVVRFFNPFWLSFLTEPAIGSFVMWDDLIAYLFGTLSILAYTAVGTISWIRSPSRTDLQRNEYLFFRLVLWAGIAFAIIYSAKLFVLTGDKESDLLWFNRNLLVAGASIFALGVCYYVFTYEDVFRVNQTFLKKTDDLENLKQLLHEAMKEQKLFTNPHLTLNDLSEAVKMKPHILSRIINDCYRQNFRDFVNGYRIEEFIDLANRETSKRFTFLALAFEVGFNSKSTFNVAFKKFTNLTPREYFVHHKVKALKESKISSTAL